MTPKEFEEDLIALDEFRSPRMIPLRPDPRLHQALAEKAHAQFMITVATSVAIFVFILAVLP